MFSYNFYRAVKLLHESEEGYNGEPASDTYDEVIGECPERFWVSGCLYEIGKIEFPCFNCESFYKHGNIIGAYFHACYELKKNPHSKEWQSEKQFAEIMMERKGITLK